MAAGSRSGCVELARPRPPYGDSVSDHVDAVVREILDSSPTLTTEQAASLARTICGPEVGYVSGGERTGEGCRDDANLSVRAWAAAIDIGVLGVAWLIVAGLVAMIWLALGSDPPIPWVAPCLGAVYLVVSWWRFGCTAGMYAMGLRVVTATGGGRPSLLRSLLRLAGLVGSVLPAGLGLLSPLLSSRSRSWWDELAGTRTLGRES